MSNKKQCNFEPSSQTSSSTICKWCGKEKWQHILLMSNKKQTAVEYIEKAYSDACYNMMIYKIQIHKDFLPNLIKQAKEMEKQQIINAYDLGMGHYGGVNRRSDAEQYYKETYEK